MRVSIFDDNYNQYVNIIYIGLRPDEVIKVHEVCSTILYNVVMTAWTSMNLSVCGIPV